MADPIATRIRRDMAGLTRDHPIFASIPRPVPVEVLDTGFAGMIHLILGQQVSIEAADAMYSRLSSTLGQVRPEPILRLDDATMRSYGFTRMKAGYARDLAEAVIGGLDLDAVARTDPEAAIGTLTGLRGIGRWTAECFLLFCAGHRDVFPAGDLALRRGWQELDGSTKTPSERELRATAEAWAPRRTAAAHLIWHAYLRRRGRR
ncbi:MAG TPA: DNA-3-methyladenine glycosylase 2 family protein [Acidimicrobiia bacterium]|nr:DNA-3-methyladenine glycosylase 2 family protein [Acidimicrobiia bacterium]